MEDKIYEFRGRKFRLIKPDEIRLFEIQKLGQVVKKYIEKRLNATEEFTEKLFTLVSYEIYASEAIIDIISTLLVRVDVKTTRKEDYEFLRKIAEDGMDITPEQAQEIFGYFINFILPKLLSYFVFSPLELQGQGEEQ